MYVRINLLQGSVSLLARLHKPRNQVLEEEMITPTILLSVPLTEYVLPKPVHIQDLYN